MKKLILTIIFTSSYLFSIDNVSKYEEAVKLEKSGLFKEAMKIYKQLAEKVISKEDKYLVNINKIENNPNKLNSFTNMKKKFYEKQINDTKDKETNESIKQIAISDFDLFPYKKNYLLPATYDLQKTADRKQFETVYQISVEKPISYDLLGFNETISAAYTQKSFWQTSKHSSPFRETNYQPEVFVMFPYENSESFKAYKVGLIHESNGRNGDESRSWNRIYAQTFFQLSNLFISPKVWYRIPEKEKDDDNPDIYKYYGYGDLTLLYAYKKHTFELSLRNNLRFNSQNKGSVEFNWAFPLPEFLSIKNSYGLVNIFSGYGNSLIDYDEEVNKIGFGIAFSR